MKNFIRVVSLAFIIMMGFNNSVESYTDDIDIEGMNRFADIYQYLNSNDYHFSTKTRLGDIYVSRDEAVIVTTPKGFNGLLFIDVLKPRHATNRVIEVGMTLDDIIRAYGSVYPMEGFWQYHRNEENCGMIYPIKSKYYSGYDVVSYQEVISSLLQGESTDGINFLIDRKTKKIVLIHYYASMHRQVDLDNYIQQYELVPALM